ncbi:flagellar hook-basal body complex protein [Ureibacillus sp. NPDC094379]
MLRSMYSGISGLKNFQTKLDVIGNNISNVNTYGFKKGRVVFKDLISQTTAGASAPSGTRGGVNAKQVGLGSQIAAIDTITGSGSLQTTSRTLDLAISGDGYFQVADSNATKSTFTNTLYTRAGNFYMDKDGYLVNSDGKYLVGYSKDINTNTNDTNFPVATDNVESNANLDANGNGAIDNTTDYKPIRIPTNAQSMSISQDGRVTFVDSAGTLRYAGSIILAKFPNAAGLEKVGSNNYAASPNAGTPILATGTSQGIGSIQSGFLEMSNVDLSEEFTEMIVAQRGFQANSRIITTSDEILQELVNLKR